MRPLTDTQKATLGTIRTFIREKGYPPTLRELGAIFGLRGTNPVASRLHWLVKKGALTVDFGKSRGIRLLEPVLCEGCGAEADATFMCPLCRARGCLKGGRPGCYKCRCEALLDEARLHVAMADPETRAEREALHDLALLVKGSDAAGPQSE